MQKPCNTLTSQWPRNFYNWCKKTPNKQKKGNNNNNLWDAGLEPPPSPGMGKHLPVGRAPSCLSPRHRVVHKTILPWRYTKPGPTSGTGLTPLGTPRPLSPWGRALLSARCSCSRCLSPTLWLGQVAGQGCAQRGASLARNLLPFCQHQHPWGSMRLGPEIWFDLCYK